MIVSINNRVNLKVLEFLRTQRNLPFIFLVNKSASGIVVEVEDDDSDGLLDFLESKGFDYEVETEETSEVKEKKKKIAKIDTFFLNPPPPVSNPWPF